VTPSGLDDVGRTLAGQPEPAVVASTTGQSNLFAAVLCPDPAALHDYLAHRLGGLPAIRSVETAPVLSTLKTVGA
jgi:hypothetical protein